MADLDDYKSFDANLLRLKIDGNVYEVPEVGIRTGILLQRAIDGDADAIAELNVTPEAFYRRLLGSAYDRMLEADVPRGSVERAAVAALADFRHGRVAAEIAWKRGQDPEALAAVMAATARILQTR